ncbi:NUDIX hydrolase [Methylobacterium radiodurans]|uniref:NUDIX hydrolase n=1 Tax=Methylobacterium radiodurans TaxID=2202828 RepID=A0A2U8VRF6_9HYPH|nr:NUDIX hydrolase [Methylobacterium radiodurans]AWN35786.1 NUDIX hydrolase [Methylobacterium radiodurans]
MVTVTDEEERAARRQIGALPFQRGPDGAISVLLVTSRESRRWVIPKGWPMKGRKPYEAAAREAYEEAGLVGQIGKRPLGLYLYEKRLKNRDSVLCQVKVFPLEVRKQLTRWPEQDQRELRWFSPAEAAEAVNEPGLAAIIRAALKSGKAVKEARNARKASPRGE